MSQSHKSNTNNNNEISRDFTDCKKGLESALYCISVPLKSRMEKVTVSANKHCRPVLPTQCDGDILKSQDQTGFKQKLVNKVKLWSNKESKMLQGNDGITTTKPDSIVEQITLSFEKLNLSANSPEEFKLKESLESILDSKTYKAVSRDVPITKTFSHPSCSQEMDVEGQSAHLESPLNCSLVTDCSSKMLTWDPWNKLGRKNKKEDRKKTDKSPLSMRNRSRRRSPSKKNKDHTQDEPLNTNVAMPEIQESYTYRSYKTKKKSVSFINEVAVVYYTGDEIVNKTTEPLKKELDQQVRNKEMRRGHIDCTIMGGKLTGDDYMSWFKK